MTRTPRRRRARHGFTLVEVMLVLVIIIIIAGLAVTAIGPALDSAKEKGATAKIQALETPLDNYRLDIGVYPATEQGLDALYEAPADLSSPDSWKGPYTRERIAPDPWGRPYQYQYPGDHNEMLPDVWSLGKDGIDGTEDDIVSWDESE